MEVELIKTQKRRTNREEEHAYQERRNKIEEYYNKLKAETTKTEVFPILSEFRKLPIIKTFQTKPTATADSDLQNDLVTTLLKDDLDKWRDRIQEEFAVKLGHSNWQTPSSLKLHPVHRLSALFSCTKCVRKSLQDQILTFEHVCVHRCPEKNKKRRARQIWEVEQFVPHNRVG